VQVSSTLWFRLQAGKCALRSAPAETAQLAQNWIASNCSEFIGKDEWPPNSSDVNPFDRHV